MIKQYIKQAWAQARQNKTFTAIYVGGVALAIATTMVFAIVYYVKLAPIYPEVNRSRTLYVRVAQFTFDNGNSWQWALSLQGVKEMFYPLKSAEAVSAENTISNVCYIQPFDNSGDFSVFTRFVDSAFFRIYEFNYLEGKPFTESDVASGARVAVITDKLASKIFGTSEGVTGKTFTMENMQYRVTGVVEECASLASSACGQVYTPYSVVSGYDNVDSNVPIYGAYHVKILAREGNGAIQAVKDEVAEVVRKYNSQQSKIKMNIYEEPTTHLEKSFQQYTNQPISWSETIRQYGIIILVLLLVPALNLSGMIAGRMDTRMMEIGVRKSYGASRTVLLNQVLVENLTLTLIGGLIGLLISWGLITLCKDWIFTVVAGSTDFRIYKTTVTGEMLFSPLVFGIALLVCVVLNLLSALVPAWNSLRHPIVNSLNAKR